MSEVSFVTWELVKIYLFFFFFFVLLPFLQTDQISSCLSNSVAERTYLFTSIKF